MQFLEERPRILFVDGLIPGQVLSLVFHLDNVIHLNNDGSESRLELVKIKFSVTTSLYSANHGNELVISGIIAVLIQKTIQVEVADLSLFLTIDKIEGLLVVPVRALEDCHLEHL